MILTGVLEPSHRHAAPDHAPRSCLMLLFRYSVPFSTVKDPVRGIKVGKI